MIGTERIVGAYITPKENILVHMGTPHIQNEFKVYSPFSSIIIHRFITISQGLIPGPNDGNVIWWLSIVAISPGWSQGCDDSYIIKISRPKSRDFFIKLITYYLVTNRNQIQVTIVNKITINVRTSWSLFRFLFSFWILDWFAITVSIILSELWRRLATQSTSAP